MHEASIMASIISSVLEELKKYPVEKVEEVSLTIGAITFLGEDQLQFAYEVLTRGTLLEGSKLVIDTEAVEVRCPSCSYEGPTELVDVGDLHGPIPALHCPRCGEGIEVTKGKGCAVRSVKVVEKDVQVQG
jgi:hydrogenase nickel incorporation protein HypA/HybF